MNFQSLESRLDEACQKINGMDPINRAAVGQLYEITFNLFRCCLRLENRLDGWEKAFPPAEVCACEPDCKPDPLEITDGVPPEIMLAASSVENWMKMNGHTKWKLSGIRSREDG